MPRGRGYGDWSRLVTRARGSGASGLEEEWECGSQGHHRAREKRDQGAVWRTTEGDNRHVETDLGRGLAHRAPILGRSRRRAWGRCSRSENGLGQGMSDHGAGLTPRTAGEIDACESEESFLSVGVSSGDRGRGGEGLTTRRERLPRVRKLRAEVGGSEEAVVTDLHETRGEDMQEEAANELVVGDGDALAVLGREAHAAVVDGLEAIVRDSNAVGVAAEVTVDLPGATEGTL